MDKDVDYEKAVEMLNSLQIIANNWSSNSDCGLKVEQLTPEEKDKKKIVVMQKYLLRAGISLETLDTLSVIHIAGTKGKGSTCALCESILRQCGFRTGFYSSPHLLEVRERIRVNGSPISKDDFIHHFGEMYKDLSERKSSAEDMPTYFMCLTIMAFKIFLSKKVDVAIIEVGIGGEYDYTNVLRKAPVVGITSLGLDHINVLGNSIESIAWHKAGIIKAGSRVYTVPQTQSALEVLKERGIELGCCSFEVVEPIQDFAATTNNCYPRDIFNINSNLAVALSKSWVNYRNELLQNNRLEPIEVTVELATKGLLEFRWFGRYHVIHKTSNSFYLDGSHTLDSIKICAEWFTDLVCKSTRLKVLIFNATGKRNSEDLLRMLVPCMFDKVFFVTNKATSEVAADTKYYLVTEDEQIQRCKDHHEMWMSFDTRTETVKVLPTVLDAVNECNEHYNVLITGSLHLVGAALSLLGSGII